jgi:hypothetical protein
MPTQPALGIRLCIVFALGSSCGLAFGASTILPAKGSSIIGSDNNELCKVTDVVVSGQGELTKVVGLCGQGWYQIRQGETYSKEFRPDEIVSFSVHNEIVRVTWTREQLAKKFDEINARIEAARARTREK